MKKEIFTLEKAAQLEAWQHKTPMITHEPQC